VTLTKDRIYLDFNATSPFSSSVCKLLRDKGDSLFGNPSALHHTGKFANRFMRETRDYLYDLFSTKANYKIVFHSGATEGINFFFRSLIFKFYTEGVRPLFLFSKVDHSASYNLKPLLESLGFPVYHFSVDSNGRFDMEEIEEAICKYGARQGECPAVMNYLFVNNETGVTWPLEKAVYLREKYKVIVHVDAVQSIGKIDNWNRLPLLDCYTYSCHKFGSLKGVGFSFLQHSLKLSPFLYGGGQQEGLRSGTENILGIYSVKLALEDLLSKSNFSHARQCKQLFLDSLKQLEHIKIIGEHLQEDAVNTVMITVKNGDTNTLLTAFDMAQIDVSSGSACAAGISLPNRILLNMGYSSEVAKSSLRFSWAPFDYSHEQWHTTVAKIITMLQRFAK
jgi:cysteine desulfurase